MRIAMVNYVYDRELADPEELLERYVTLPGWAEGLTASGGHVTVFQRFSRDARIDRAGVSYRFIEDALGAWPRGWEVPWRLHWQVRDERPEVVHVHGMVFPLQVASLRAVLPKRCRLVVQHHAEEPWSGARGMLQRWALRGASAFLFTTPELAVPWLERGTIRHPGAVHPVLEGSTRFRPEPRAQARARTGMHGEPAVLWVGRLVGLKDPLTALAGFERALEQLPAARLYMIYGDSELLPSVRARIAASERLRHAVELVGPVPHEALPAWYSGADLFLLGSHQEGSGYALIEAMACGAVPVVTSIPSFRSITGDGAVGALWPPSDAQALAEALVQVARRPLEPQSAAVRSRFEELLCFEAIGRRALAIYQGLPS